MQVRTVLGPLSSREKNADLDADKLKLWLNG